MSFFVPVRLLYLTVQLRSTTASALVKTALRSTILNRTITTTVVVTTAGPLFVLLSPLVLPLLLMLLIALPTVFHVYSYYQCSCCFFIFPTSTTALTNRFSRETFNAPVVRFLLNVWSTTCSPRGHTYLLGVYSTANLKPSLNGVNFVFYSRGRLADTDVRWNTISSAADDRTEEEKRPNDITSTKEASEFPMEDGRSTHVAVKRQPKSR